jgi:hypothetical protein
MEWCVVVVLSAKGRSGTRFSSRGFSFQRELVKLSLCVGNARTWHFIFVISTSLSVIAGILLMLKNLKKLSCALLHRKPQTKPNCRFIRFLVTGSLGVFHKFGARASAFERN